MCNCIKIGRSTRGHSHTSNFTLRNTPLIVPHSIRCMHVYDGAEGKVEYMYG